MSWLNWPNRITLARIALVAPLVICLLYLNQGGDTLRRVAFGLFVLTAASDGLDGFLARRLHEVTPLGRFLDPVADKLLTTCAVILLSVEATAVHGYKLPSWVPVIAIGKDVAVVVGFCLVYAATGVFFVRPRVWGKACTLLQSVMIALVLLAPDLPSSFRGAVVAAWWVAGAAAVVAVVDYVRIGNRFAAEHGANL